MNSFKEFHLKTSERAMHHAAAASFKVNNENSDIHVCLCIYFKIFIYVFSMNISI